jgi:hypothetical protein
LPEIFDPATGQKLAQELNATAELLGFDPNEISDVAAIKALKSLPNGSPTRTNTMR